MADEQARLADEHEAAYSEAERATQGVLAEHDPSMAWNPDQFYGNDQARSLEDLEHEHRQEEAALAAQQRAGGTEPPGPAGPHQGVVEEGARPVGGAAGVAGRDEAEESTPAAEPPPRGIEPPANLPIVKHTTKRGKVIEGVIRSDIDHAQAKALDPYTFKKNGGWFVRRDAAEAEAQGMPPPTVEAAASPRTAVQDVADAARRDLAQKQAQVAKLRSQAKTLADGAAADLGRDRQANTARRASMAASAVADASSRAQLAETMNNIATAIENGEAPRLSGVTSRAQIEALDQALLNGQYRTAQQTPGARWEKERERPPTAVDAANARMPDGSFHRTHAQDLAGELEGKRGFAPLVRWLKAVASYENTVVTPTIEQRTALEKAIKAVPASYAGKRIKEALAERERFVRMGINGDDDLHKALLEYIDVRGGTRAEDPIKRLERNLVGNKSVGVDFFPTPPELVENLVREADIKPGMRVLEPSAGKGDIADAMKGAGGAVDTIEISPTLREILEAKGYTPVGQDFMDYRPEQGYDRIVMNPPFSNRLDAEHVRHAYDMLNPGGRLVAIMGEGSFFGTDKKATGFRDWLSDVGGESQKLPDGSFKSAFRPTGVKTRMVVIDKSPEAAASVPPEREALSAAAQPLPPPPGEAKPTFEDLIARNEKVKADAQEYAERGAPAKFVDGHGITYLVSKDLNYPPDGWRVTMFGTDGQPSGHWEAKNAYEAFREVLAKNPERVGTNHIEPPLAARAPRTDSLGRAAGSWFVVDKATGKPVMETFEARTADAINRNKYDVVPAIDWLASLNRKAGIDIGASTSASDRGLIEPGDRLRSRSGRELSPAPKFSPAQSDRTATNAIRKIDTWLLDEARKEAVATKNDHLTTLLKGLDTKNFTPSDRDTVNEVLFGRTEGPDAANRIRMQQGVEGEAPAGRAPAMETGNTVLGHTWDEIQAAQSKTGRLSRPIDTSKPARQPATADDRALLAKHGSIDALKAAGLHGVADRLEAPFSKLAAEASDIADGVAASKKRAMIYEADAKEALAVKRGLPADTYYDMPFDDWRAEQAKDRVEPPKPEAVALTPDQRLAEADAAHRANSPAWQKARDEYHAGRMSDTDFLAAQAHEKSLVDAWDEADRVALKARNTDLLGRPITETTKRGPEPTIRTDPNQAVMPGMEPSAVQAQAARDQSGRGALQGEGPQKRADEGLFAPDTSGQAPMFSLRQTNTDEFKRWFGASKVVDRDGSPLVVYHASDADISHFAKSKLGSNTAGNASSKGAFGTAKLGFWFADHPIADRIAAAAEYPVHLAIENPADISLYDLIDDVEARGWRAVLRDYKAYGYDGLRVGDQEFGGTSYVAFEPTQIKSAIGNSGAFDPNDPRIQFSLRRRIATAFDGVRAPDIRRQMGLAASSQDNMGAMRKTLDEVQWLLSPTSRGPEAKQMEAVVRRRASLLARGSNQAIHALENFATAVERLKPDQQLAITHRVETGQPQPTPELQLAMSTIKRLYEQRLRMLQSIGKLKDVLSSDDYMGRIYSNYHEWKAGEEAKSQTEAERIAIARGVGKSPVQGSGAFLKQRTFATLEEAMAAGLIPVTTNPIKMQILKIREMDRFYHGTRLADEIKDAGLAHWVPANADAEAAAKSLGWVQLNDKVFRPRIPGGAVGAFGRVEPGNYWAPEQAATVFNNYVSRGMAGNSVIYDTLRYSNNALNSAQLGLSGFHATFVTLDSAMSSMALGLQQVSRGITGRDLGQKGRATSIGQGLRNMAEGFAFPVAAARTVRLGSEARRAWLDPQGATPEMAKLADLLNTGGGRISMDQFYRSNASGTFFKNLHDLKNPDGAFREAWQMMKDTPLTAPFKIVGRMVDTLNEPLMGQLVPRMKVGVFSAMARDFMERHPNATPDEASDAMTKAWDSVENRLGQMTYDNVFWNKTLKDLAFLMTRSVGWNLGTVRELAGAGIDTAQAVRDMATGKAPELTNRMAYAMAMPLLTALIGASVTYMLTGKGPDQMLDYFYPRSGTGPVNDPDRLSIPGYIKDVVAYYKAPVQTVLNKMSPLPNALEEIYHNRDYYGGIIYAPEIGESRTVAYAQYMLNQSLPFSVRAMMKNDRAGASMLAQQLAFFGIQPAPQSVTHPERGEAWQMRQDMLAVRKRNKEQGLIRLSP